MRVPIIVSLVVLPFPMSYILFPYSPKNNESYTVYSRTSLCGSEGEATGLLHMQSSPAEFDSTFGFLEQLLGIGMGNGSTFVQMWKRKSRTINKI